MIPHDRSRDARSRCFIAAAGVLALAFTARARDFVVAPNGNDSNAGTVAAPLRTISRAASRMGPGDTCYVRTGTYRETVSAILRRFKKRGLVDLGYRRIDILDGEGLRDMAGAW